MPHRSLGETCSEGVEGQPSPGARHHSVVSTRPRVGDFYAEAFQHDDLPASNARTSGVRTVSLRGSTSLGETHVSNSLAASHGSCYVRIFRLMPSPVGIKAIHYGQENLLRFSPCAVYASDLPIIKKCAPSKSQLVRPRPGHFQAAINPP